MHRDSGQSRAEAIRSAIREIRVPLVGSTITPIVVFLPLISITGVNGVFFRALAVTVGMALLTSLALALTWTPTLSHYFIRQRSGGNAAEHHAVPPRLMSVYERVLRITLEHKLVLAVFCAAADRRHRISCYHDARLRPAAGDGRGRLHRRLHHARRLFAGGNQPRDHAHGRDPPQATPEVESTSRRTGLQLGLAQVTEANTGDISVKLKRDRKRSVRRSDRRRARQDQERRTGARHRIPAASAGHDRRPDQRAGAGGDQAVRAGPGAARPSGPRRWATPSRRFPAWWTCSTASKTPSAGRPRTFKVDPVVAARAGFSPQEVELDASAILQGEPASAPVVVNDRAYTIRVRFPHEARQHAGIHPQHAAGQRHRQDGDLGSLASMVEDSRPDRNPPRQPAAQRAGDRALRGHQPGRRDEGGAAGHRRFEAAAEHPRAIRRAVRGAAASRSRTFASCWCWPCVLVFIVLLFEFGNFAAPLAVLASALLSTCGVFAGAAGHRDHVQSLVVHGADHGDRHRGQERHSAARCRPEVPRRRRAGRRRA